MTYNELPLTKDIRQALEKVLEYCWKDEEADYLSIPEHERPNEHIYHSLQKIRLALDTTPQRFDIDAFLESRNQIAILWAVEDVQSIRPDLNEEQSWEVLGRAEHIHDCNFVLPGTYWKTSLMTCSRSPTNKAKTRVHNEKPRRVSTDWDSHSISHHRQVVTPLSPDLIDCCHRAGALSTNGNIHSGRVSACNV